ncbi:MAG: hypothetical protein ABI883_05480 [Chthoniobacterales bacterium]
MKKLQILAVAAFCAFLSSAAWAGDACCAHGAGKMTKEACSATFANLNLNVEQQAKMEKLAEECTKGGCNKDTMATMEKSAKDILSKEQFASWKAKCSGGKAETATRS